VLTTGATDQTLPSDPVLDLSLVFPSFFLLFPEDSELADLLFAFSFKEMFRLTGCDVEPGAAPSCSSSRSDKQVNFHNSIINKIIPL